MSSHGSQYLDFPLLCFFILHVYNFLTCSQKLEGPRGTMINSTGGVVLRLCVIHVTNSFKKDTFIKFFFSSKSSIKNENMLGEGRGGAFIDSDQNIFAPVVKSNGLVLYILFNPQSVRGILNKIWHCGTLESKPTRY